MTAPGTRTRVRIRRTSRASYVASLALLVLGGALVVIAYGRQWVAAELSDPGLPVAHVSFRGRDLYPLGPAAGLLGLGSCLAVMATGRRPRVGIGVVAVAAGLLGAGMAIRFVTDETAVATAAVKNTEEWNPAVTISLDFSPWWPLALAGGLAICAGGILILTSSRSWPVMSARYQRHPSRSNGAAARPGGAGPQRSDVPGRQAWDALDRGEDPTASPDLPQ